MRKLFLLFIIIILIITCTSCNQEEYLRIRIIANSNELIDIENKTIVRNTLKNLFENNELTYHTLTVSNVSDKLNKYLSNDLYSKLTISKCISYYPAKTYNNTFIQSGNYETLLIEIGKAEGSNFWTLIYPEYFGVEFEETNEIEYRSYIYDQFFNKTKQMK